MINNSLKMFAYFIVCITLSTFQTKAQVITLDFNEHTEIETFDSSGQFRGVIGFQYDPSQLPQLVDDSPSGFNGDRSVQFFGEPGLSSAAIENQDYNSLGTFTIEDQDTTVEMWVYAEEYNSLQSFCSFGTRGYQPVLNFGMVDTYVSTLFTPTRLTPSPKFHIPLKTWTHIAFVILPEQKDVLIYVDSNYQTKTTFSQYNRWSGQIVTIGSTLFGEGLYGKIDRFRIHDEQLFSSQFDSDPLYKKEALPSTRIYYDFDEDNFPINNKGTEDISVSPHALKLAQFASPSFSRENPSRDLYDLSLQFKGKGEWITFEDGNENLQLSNNGFAFEAYVKYDSLPMQQGILFSYGEPGVSGYSLAVGSLTGQPKRELILTAYGISAYSAEVIPDDSQWHHIGVIGSKTDRQLRFYVDGILQYSRRYSPRFNRVRDSKKLIIGGEFLPGVTNVVTKHFDILYPFKGYLDRIRIYNQEIALEDFDIINPPFERNTPTPTITAVPTNTPNPNPPATATHTPISGGQTNSIRLWNGFEGLSQADISDTGVGINSDENGIPLDYAFHTDESTIALPLLTGEMSILNAAERTLERTIFVQPTNNFTGMLLVNNDRLQDQYIPSNQGRFSPPVQGANQSNNFIMMFDGGLNNGMITVVENAITQPGEYTLSLFAKVFDEDAAGNGQNEYDITNLYVQFGYFETSIEQTTSADLTDFAINAANANDSFQIQQQYQISAPASGNANPADAPFSGEWIPIQTSFHFTKPGNIAIYISADFPFPNLPGGVDVTAIALDEFVLTGPNQPEQSTYTPITTSTVPQTPTFTPTPTNTPTPTSTPTSTSTPTNTPIATPTQGGFITKLLHDKVNKSDQFGSAISIDEDVLAIGAPYYMNQGAVFIYRKIQSQWIFEKMLTIETSGISTGSFGYSVSIKGNYLAIGGASNGYGSNSYNQVYLYEKDETDEWNMIRVFSSSDHHFRDEFITGLHIVEDLILISTPLIENENNSVGAIYIYKKNNRGGWDFHQRIINDDNKNNQFGSTVSIDGTQMIVRSHGGEFVGYTPTIIHFYHLNNEELWQEDQQLIMPYDESIGRKNNTININGFSAMIGASEDSEDSLFSGAVYCYQKNENNNWTIQQRITAPDASEFDYFGSSISIGDNFAAIGAMGCDNFKGAVYLYKREFNGLWTFVEKIVAYDGQPNECFGGNILLENNWLVVGVPRDNDFGDYSGSTYIYDFNTNNIIATPTPDSPIIPSPTITPTPIQSENADELIIAQGSGGSNIVSIRNFDSNAGVPVTAQLNSIRALNDRVINQIGGGQGRSTYISTGDINRDGYEDAVFSFGSVTDDALFPNLVIPFDLRTNRPIGHSFSAFPNGSSSAVTYTQGDLRTSIGNFMHADQPLLAVSQGAGSQLGLIRLFEYTGSPAPHNWRIVSQFQPLDDRPSQNNANGGVTLSSGDVDGDGLDELVVGQTNSETSLTQFTIIDVRDDRNHIRHNFVGFPPGYRGQGGIETTVADLNGDGVSEIIVSGKGYEGTNDIGNILSIIRPNVVENQITGFSRPDNSIIKVIGDDSINPGGGLNIASGEMDGDLSNGEEIVFGSGEGAPQSFYRVVKILYDPNIGENGSVTSFSYLIGPPKNLDFVVNAFMNELNPSSGTVFVETINYQ